MRHAGALRLDHAMGIERLLWVPEGATANEGAYVRNNSEALLAILAVESHRQRCMVVGEDLGTIPSGFRERMAEAGLYGMSVLMFEHDGKSFGSSSTYAQRSIASFGTHDLLPFQGWWSKHGDQDDGRALARAIGASGNDQGAGDAKSATSFLHGFLGRSSAKVALAQFDDLAGEVTPVNVPGTTTERPNWRRRMNASVEAVFASDLAKDAIREISRDRAVTASGAG